jgi:DNA helicase IV
VPECQDGAVSDRADAALELDHPTAAPTTDRTPRQRIGACSISAQAPRMQAEVSDELSVERAWLRHATACLRRMYDQAKNLDPQAGSEASTRALASIMVRRLASLRHDPGTPLFFGRLDYADPKAERFYIGRRHVRDDDREPVVLDWRAALCADFYQASADDPRGLERRRRFGFVGGELSGYEDELLRSGTDQEFSGILAEEIERPRVGAMRDIVATIQPDQDHIVRAELGTTICVQGGPGTGKTAVGLHRAAFLLYTHAERLSRTKVLVIGPNTVFLNYIGQVLPALGEVEVEHKTLDQLVAPVDVRSEDSPEAARVKGDARMALVLARAVGMGIVEPTESLVVAVNGRDWRVSLVDLQKIVADVRRKRMRYAAGRRALAAAVGLTVARRIGFDESKPSDRLPDRIAGSKAVRDWVNTVQPVVEPKKLLVRLLSEAEFLAEAADGGLSSEEQEAISWGVVPKRLASVRWTAADAVLMDEIGDLLERTPSYGHVVVDEAQDLSAMQCRAVGRRCSTSSATLLGDLAQATSVWATSSWRETLVHLGKPDGRVEVLSTSYRVPGAVLEFANRLLPHLGPEVSAVTPGRREAGTLRVLTSLGADLLGDAANAARVALGRPGSVGIVVPDSLVGPMADALSDRGVEHGVLGGGEVPGRLAVLPVTMVKGLEFDSVVVVEPAEIARAERQGMRRLYVALTRAVSEMTIVHAEPLPPALARTCHQS